MVVVQIYIIVHNATHSIVPIFIIGPTVSVDESTPDVEICVSTSSSLGRNVIVTAETGMKNGTMYQATGEGL